MRQAVRLLSQQADREHEEVIERERVAALEFLVDRGHIATATRAAE